MSVDAHPVVSDPADRWLRSLEEPFAAVRDVADHLAGEGWAPADASGARVLSRLAGAPPARVMLDAVRREVPVATRVGADLPPGPASLTPDGGHVAVLTEGRVEMWDHERGRVAWNRELPGLRGGRRLAARGARSVVVGSVRGSSLDLLVVAPNDTAVIGALEGGLVGLGVWEPDRLVSVGDDGGVTVWSLVGGPARRMAAPSATPLEDAVVEGASDRVVLTHRGGLRRVLDLVTGEVEETAPGPPGATWAGRTVRAALDPAGRLRLVADGAELGSVACAVREGTRLGAVPREALLVVGDADARLPTTVWTVRGALLHEALRRPLIDATPEQLAVVDAIGGDGLSDAARCCLTLLREVLALRLRDAVGITVESVAGRSGADPTSAVGRGPGPRDVEIDEPGSEAGPGSAPPVPAVLGAIRSATWWG